MFSSLQISKGFLRNGQESVKETEGEQKHEQLHGVKEGQKLTVWITSVTAKSTSLWRIFPKEMVKAFLIDTHRLD